MAPRWRSSPRHAAPHRRGAPTSAAATQSTWPGALGTACGAIGQSARCAWGRSSRGSIAPPFRRRGQGGVVAPTQQFRVSPVLATLGGLQGRAVPGGRAVSRLPAPIQRRDQGGVPAESHPVGVSPIDDDVQSALIGARHARYVRIPQEWLGDDAAFSPDRFTRNPEPGQLDEFRTAG